MGTDLDVVVMLAALLTMLAALVWWDGWPSADEPPASPSDQRRHS